METTANNAESPAGTLKVVDGVNTTPPRKKSYTKLVVLLGFIVGIALIAKYPAASAGPFDEYNEGLKQVVCQLLDSGYSGDQVIAELKKSFASFESQIVAVGGKPGDHRGFVKQAVADKCPQYVGEV